MSESVTDADGNVTFMQQLVSLDYRVLASPLQQRFDVYATFFYGFVPREGWAFVNDGPCAGPADCGA